MKSVLLASLALLLPVTAHAQNQQATQTGLARPEVVRFLRKRGAEEDWGR
jgi:hypothetical protein